MTLLRRVRAETGRVEPWDCVVQRLGQNPPSVGQLQIDPASSLHAFDVSTVVVFHSYEELFGEELDLPLLERKAAGLALESALIFVGRLGCLVESRDAMSREGQQHVIRRLGLDAGSVEALAELLAQEPFRAILAPQHISNALRLMLRACDAEATVPTTDPASQLLMLQLVLAAAAGGDEDVASGAPERLVSYFLRQSGLHSRPVPLYGTTRQAELLTSAWAERYGADAANELDDELAERTGMRILELIRASLGLYARFATYAEEETEPASAVEDPLVYLERAALPRQVAERFVERYSATAVELKRLITEEDRNHGPTSFRSTTFDRKPLLRLSNGAVLPTSFLALERLSFEGAYWACRPPDREQTFTRKYGAVAEHYTVQAIERISKLDPGCIKFSGEFEYGPKRERRKASDANVRYQRDWLAFEVVTGRPQVATITRGDLRAFRDDVERLVTKKARQLAKRQKDAVLFGSLKLSPAPRPDYFWPIVVCVDGFPTLPPLYEFVRDIASRAANGMKNHPTLTILDSDDVAALERLGEKGYPLLHVMRDWKSRAPRVPLGHWLMSTEWSAGLGLASHHRQVYDNLAEPWAQEMSALAP